MPEMDGESVALEVRRFSPSLPIVLASAYQVDEDGSALRWVDGQVAKHELSRRLVGVLESLLHCALASPPSRPLVGRGRLSGGFAKGLV